MWIQRHSRRHDLPAQVHCPYPAFSQQARAGKPAMQGAFRGNLYDIRVIAAFVADGEHGVMAKVPVGPEEIISDFLGASADVHGGHLQDADGLVWLHMSDGHVIRSHRRHM